MSTMPTEDLQLRAEDQRRRLHTAMHELRDRVRENLDGKEALRRYAAPLSAAGAVLGLLLGYGLAGLWLRD